MAPIARRRWRRSAMRWARPRSRARPPTSPFSRRSPPTPDFASGDVDTGLIARHQDSVDRDPCPGPAHRRTGGYGRSAVGRWAFAGCRRSLVDNAGLRAFPQAHAASDAFPRRGRDRRCDRRPGGRSRRCASARRKRRSTLDPGQPARAALWPGHVTMFRGAQSHTFTIPDPFERSEEAASKADTLRAPMPGLVKIVRAAKGDAVSKGQPLLVLEAMKMEHTIVAPRDARACRNRQRGRPGDGRLGAGAVRRGERRRGASEGLTGPPASNEKWPGHARPFLVLHKSRAGLVSTGRGFAVRQRPHASHARVRAYRSCRRRIGVRSCCGRKFVDVSASSSIRALRAAPGRSRPSTSWPKVRPGVPQRGPSP